MTERTTSNPLIRPRNDAAVRAALLSACGDPEFARDAYYAAPFCHDLSPRFTSLAQRCLGNLLIDTRSEGPGAAVVTVTDLESNVSMSELFSFDPNGGRQALRLAEARSRRTLLLGMVPSHVQEQCLQLCQETTRREDAKHLPEHSKAVVASLAALGVDSAALKAHLGHAPASLTVKEVEELRSIASLLRDGEITWERLREHQHAHQAAPPPLNQKSAPAPKKKPGRKKAQRDAAAPAPNGASKAAPVASAPRESLRNAEDDPPPLDVAGAS